MEYVWDKPDARKRAVPLLNAQFWRRNEQKETNEEQNGLKDYERVVTGLYGSSVKEGSKKKDEETQSEVRVKVNGSKCCSFVCIGENT